MTGGRTPGLITEKAHFGAACISLIDISLIDAASEPEDDAPSAQEVNLDAAIAIG
jgi:hypothetical protein